MVPADLPSRPSLAPSVSGRYLCPTPEPGPHGCGRLPVLRLGGLFGLVEHMVDLSLYSLARHYRRYPTATTVYKLARRRKYVETNSMFDAMRVGTAGGQQQLVRPRGEERVELNSFS